VVVDLFASQANARPSRTRSHIGIINPHIRCPVLDVDQTLALGRCLTDVRNISIGRICAGEEIKHAKECTRLIVVLEHITSCAQGDQSRDGKERGCKHCQTRDCKERLKVQTRIGDLERGEELDIGDRDGEVHRESYILAYRWGVDLFMHVWHRG
jgi:hypothetical protein